MKKLDFSAAWAAFLHWKGWKALIRWSGWRWMFSLPEPMVLLLSILCAVGLGWVFLTGREQTLPAYALYPLSAYCLTALCVKVPGMIRGGKGWVSAHPKTAALFQNSEAKFVRNLYREQIVNFAYGIYKITAGVMLGSAWIGCEGIYNMTQALIQLYQILRRKYAGSLVRQWKSYRQCGVLILLMHLTLIGLVFQMVNRNRASEQGEIMVIITAFFAFYKITRSFISIARDRKAPHPVDSAIRMLNLTQAIFAIFSLQAAMFHTFGTGESWEQAMNILTGCAVCLLIVSTGIYMIRRGTREIKQLQENSHGA